MSYQFDPDVEGRLFCAVLARDEGPSKARCTKALAAHCGMSPRAAHDCLREMEKMGGVSSLGTFEGDGAFETWSVPVGDGFVWFVKTALEAMRPESFLPAEKETGGEA